MSIVERIYLLYTHSLRCKSKREELRKENRTTKSRAFKKSKRKCTILKRNEKSDPRKGK
jgi:hypothetical protein